MIVKEKLDDHEEENVGVEKMIQPPWVNFRNKTKMLSRMFENMKKILLGSITEGKTSSRSMLYKLQNTTVTFMLMGNVNVAKI